MGGGGGGHWDNLIMLPITIYIIILCAVLFYLNAITISTVSDFVCDNERPQCLTLSYTNAYMPTSYCDYNFLSLYSALVTLW